jgi:hypothetical protein
VGVVLLAVLLVALGRLLWRARATGPAGAVWAGVVAAAAAFAVHSGFDFVWHLPAVVLTGPAVAFSSGGLFLDVQVESPAHLVSRGAAADVPLEVTCNATGSVEVFVSVTQKAGSGVAQGFGFASFGCTGSGQQVTVRVQASGGKTFKQGTAVASAEVFGCNNVTCGSETDSEVIDLKK